MRTTIGLRYWSFEKNCSDAASPRIWSHALWKYARYWISGIGSMPMFAKPCARPRIIGLVEQRVEHARALERLVQALGDRVDAALLRDVLAEQQRLGILAEQIVQRVVDLDREMPRRQVLRQLFLAAEHGEALFRVVRAARFGVDLVRRVRRQRRDDVGELASASGGDRPPRPRRSTSCGSPRTSPAANPSSRAPIRARSPPNAAADRSLRPRRAPRRCATRSRSRCRRGP